MRKQIFNEIINKLVTYKLILFIFLLSFVFRSTLINKFPIGITHDELNYIMAAKSLANGSGFVPGTAPAVIKTSMKYNDVVIAEVPSIILAFFIKLGINPRLVGALFNSSIVVVFYFFVLNFIKNKAVATISSILMMINPWSFLIGRTIFETNYFVLFFLIGLLILIKTKGRKIYFSIIPFALGFFSYTGGQISFYLFMLTGLIYRYLEDRSLIKLYLNYVLIITTMLLLYLFLVFNNQSFASRGGELFLPTNLSIDNMVDKERLMAVPNRVNNLFINKASVYLREVMGKYYRAFDANNLFVNGELRAAFSLQKHGNFYIIDFIFLLLGIASLYSKYRKEWFFLILFIGVSVVTSVLSTVEYSYTQRAALIYPFLILLISYGLNTLVNLLKSSNKRLLLTILITVVYFFLFANMLHMYFFRVPVYASDGWFFQDRLLSNYITRVRDSAEDQVTVVTFEPKIIYEEYLYYSGLYSADSIKVINKNLNNKEYRFKNVTFIDTCPVKTNRNIFIIDPLKKCLINDAENPLRITRFRDVYENYLIYNDSFCSRFELSSYVYPWAFKDFFVEKQNDELFCQSWITKL